MIRVIYGDNDYAVSNRYQRERRTYLGEHGDDSVVMHDGSQLEVANLPQLLGGQSLFSPSQLHIVRDASANKAIWDALGEKIEQAGDVDLLLVETKPDKRTKTWKWLSKKAEMIECKLPSERELIGWLTAHARTMKVELSETSSRFLVEYVGTDQWQLADAVTKLSLSGQKPSRELIERLIEPNPQASAFELLDAIVARNQAKAIERLDIVRRSEDPYKFLGLLISQFFALAVCQSSEGRPAKQIASEVGIHPFVVQKSLPIARKIDREQLSQMIEEIDRCDRALKTTGVEPWDIIETLVRQLSS